MSSSSGDRPGGGFCKQTPQPPPRLKPLPSPLPDFSCKKQDQPQPPVTYTLPNAPKDLPSFRDRPVCSPLPTVPRLVTSPPCVPSTKSTTASCKKYNFLDLLRPCQVRITQECCCPYSDLSSICSWFASPKYFHLCSSKRCCKTQCVYSNERKLCVCNNSQANELRSKISTNTLHGVRSVGDLRAWSVCCDDQRRYFQDMMLQSGDAPEVVDEEYEIVDDTNEASPLQIRYETLLSQKDDEIERLKQLLKQMQKPPPPEPPKPPEPKPVPPPPSRKPSEPKPVIEKKESKVEPPPRKASDPPPRKASDPPPPPSRKASEPPPPPPRKPSDPPPPPEKAPDPPPPPPQEKEPEPPPAPPSRKPSEPPPPPSRKPSDPPPPPEKEPDPAPPPPPEKEPEPPPPSPPEKEPEPPPPPPPEKEPEPPLPPPPVKESEPPSPVKEPQPHPPPPPKKDPEPPPPPVKEPEPLPPPPPVKKSEEPPPREDAPPQETVYAFNTPPRQPSFTATPELPKLQFDEESCGCTEEQSEEPPCPYEPEIPECNTCHIPLDECPCVGIDSITQFENPYDTRVVVDGNLIKKIQGEQVLEEMHPERLVAEYEWLKEAMMANGQRVNELEEALFGGGDYDKDDRYTTSQLQNQTRLLRQRLASVQSQLDDKNQVEQQLRDALDAANYQLVQYEEEVERNRLILINAQNVIMNLTQQLGNQEGWHPEQNGGGTCQY